MKKILLIPAVIGLVAVPSFVVAHRGADDNKPNEVRKEDHRQDSPAQANTTDSDSSGSDDSPDLSDDNSNDDSSSTNTPGSSSSVTLDQAKAIALSVFPNKTIKKVETELEHGVLVYSVRFTDSSRVDVNSNDRSIVRTEQEDDNHSEDSDDDAHDGSSDDDEDDS